MFTISVWTEYRTSNVYAFCDNRPVRVFRQCHTYGKYIIKQKRKHQQTTLHDCFLYSTINLMPCIVNKLFHLLYDVDCNMKCSQLRNYKQQWSGSVVFCGYYIILRISSYLCNRWRISLQHCTERLKHCNCSRDLLTV